MNLVLCKYEYFIISLYSGWPDAKMHLEDKVVKKGGHFPKEEDNGQFNKIIMY